MAASLLHVKGQRLREVDQMLELGYRRAVLFQLLCGGSLMGVYTNSYCSFLDYTNNRPLFLKMIEKQTKDPKITYNPVFQR